MSVSWNGLLCSSSWSAINSLQVFRFSQNDLHTHPTEYNAEQQLFDLCFAQMPRNSKDPSVRSFASYCNYQLGRRLENARWVSPRGSHQDVILMPDGETPAYYPELRATQMWDSAMWQQHSRDPVKYWDVKFFNNSMSSWQHDFNRVTPKVQRKLRALSVEDELNWLKDPSRKRPLVVPLGGAA